MRDVIGKQFRCLSIAINRVLSVPVSEVGVMRSLLVLVGLLVIRRLFVMVGRTLMMMSRVMVVFPSLRHAVLLP
jgi:hypothetical protein